MVVRHINQRQPRQGLHRPVLGDFAILLFDDHVPMQQICYLFFKKSREGDFSPAVSRGVEEGKLATLTRSKLEVLFLVLVL